MEGISSLMKAPAHLIRFINPILLVLVVVLGLSGLVMLYGTWQPWVFDLHRMTGWSLVALLPWKALIVSRSLSRRVQETFGHSLVVIASLILALLLLLVIGLGAMWMWRIGPYRSLFLQTLIAWHWILGLLLLPVFIFHVWKRWPNPSLDDFFTRRDFLKLLAIGAAGVAGGLLSAWLAGERAPQDSPRRFTGSRGFGFLTGNDFPITGEGTIHVDASQWRLSINGAVDSPLNLSYEDLLARRLQAKRAAIRATIDCTSGWYSVQDWQGVPLMQLLDEAGWRQGVTGVRLVSLSGYNHSYPLAEARTILLATHVSGETLAPRHGFPVRVVVPGRRGWFWVKWLARIDVLDEALDLIGGILCSPRQVLRQF
jgi:DMSO/TMAO reductase YedYZ molybdopterin-dependent catalytic subunit